MVGSPVAGKKITFSRMSPLLVPFLAFLVVTGPLSFLKAEAAQVSLTWNAPATFTDGTPVTGLDGYKLYVGNASGVYQQGIDVGNQTSYALSDLSDGATYYFAVTAYGTDGMESAYSHELVMTFPALPVTYTIAATSEGGGTITAVDNTNVIQATSGSTTLTSVTVNNGASQAFSTVAATGNHIADVTVDGTSVGPVGSYSFASVGANHTISVTFAPNSYTITASAGIGGSIAPPGAAKLNYGASQSYAVAATTGYSIADVKVDGVSVGAVTYYTFANVSANHSIAATFAVDTYTVSASAGAGGTISPVGIRLVHYGGTQAYSITPATGYQVAGVKIDGNAVGAVTNYTFSKVSANHTIAATFAASIRNKGR